MPGLSLSEAAGVTLSAAAACLGGTTGAQTNQVTNDGINLTPVRAGPDGAGVDGVTAVAATALLSSAGNGGTVTELEPAPPLASFRSGH